MALHRELEFTSNITLRGHLRVFGNNFPFKKVLYILLYCSYVYDVCVTKLDFYMQLYGNIEQN